MKGDFPLTLTKFRGADRMSKVLEAKKIK